MPRLFFKYNIKSRGREGNENTWVIKDLDTKEEVLIDHIEIKTPISTAERNIGNEGFGMYTEGKIQFRLHPQVGKYVVILPES